jgi:hypothetical protein
MNTDDGKGPDLVHLRSSLLIDFDPMQWALAIALLEARDRPLAAY